MIEPITSGRHTRQIVVYDLEWVPHTMQFRLGGVFDGEDYRRFRKVEDLLSYMLSRKFRGKWFYAHFGGMADITFFLRWLEEQQDLLVKASFSGSSAVIVTVRRKNHKGVWRFIDSFWLLRDSLRNIGKSLGMPKGAEVHCRTCSKLEEKERPAFCVGCQKKLEAWYAEVPLSELASYNEQDCRILHKAITRFESEVWELGGQLQMTIASTAMNLFRRAYLKSGINTSQSMNMTARDAYVASRVEVIEKHLKHGHLYDINSSFPYSMTKPLPGSVLKVGRGLPTKGLYLAELTVRVPSMHLPPLPFRHHKTHKIFFPVGVWRSWFSTPDVELLLESGGTVEKCHQSVTFDPRDDLAAYVLDIYGRRKKETDSFRRLVYKYLLNCLYGKFAEQGEKTTLWMHPDSVDCPHGGLHPNNSCVEELFPGAILVTDQVEVPHEHVPIAAFVTAYSRRTIYRYMRPCEQVAYLDTDSLATSDLLPSSKKLGAMKYEMSFKDGEFLRPKLYRLDKKVKAKGFSRMSYEKFVEVAKGGAIEVERMMRVREMMRRGELRPNEYMGTKQLKPETMAKRSFFRKTGHSRPWDVKEIRKALG